MICSGCRKRNDDDSLFCNFCGAKNEPVSGVKKVWKIGSDSDNKIVLNYDMISGHHCRIVLDGDRLYISDEASTNGTFVNGMKIPPFQLTHIQPTDEIRLGSHLLFPEEIASILSFPKIASKMHGKSVSKSLPRAKSWNLGREPDNDIIEDFPMVSGHHCRIHLNEQNSFSIQDLGSTNGTFVNGIRIPSFKMTPVNFGDEIRLGSHTLSPNILSSITHERPQLESPKASKPFKLKMPLGFGEDDITNNSPHLGNSLGNVIQEVEPKTIGDPRTSQVVIVDFSTSPKRVIKSIPIWRRRKTDLKYYMVFNTNDKRNEAVCEGMICRVRDFERQLKAELKIRYRVSCLPENTETAALALSGTGRPEDKLRSMLERWVREYTFQREKEFIDNFADERKRLENYLVRNAMEQAGLTFHPIISMAGEMPGSFKITNLNIPVKVTDHNKELGLTLNLETESTELSRVQSIPIKMDQSQFEKHLKDEIRRYFISEVTLEQFYYDLEMVQQDVLRIILDHYAEYLGQRVLKSELTASNAPPLPRDYQIPVEYPYDKLVGGQTKGKVSINARMVLKFQHRHVVHYMRANRPEPDLWAKEQIDSILERLLFQIRYADLSDLSVIENSFILQIKQAATEIGFSAENVRLSSALPDIEGRERFESYVNTPVKLIGYQEPIIVENKIKMVLENQRLYMEKKSPEPGPWVQEALKQTFNDVLFEVTYLDFILDFKTNYEELIKSGMRVKASIIGYRLDQLVIQPQFEPLNWLKTFSVETSGEYATEIGNKVPLKVIVHMRVGNLREVKNYINTAKPDILPEIQRTMDSVIKSVMIRITPHHFYMRFSYAPEGEELPPLMMILEKNISLKLENEFNAVIDSITPQMGTEGNEVVQRLNTLIKNIGDLNFEVISLHGGEKIQFHGQYLVNGVVDDQSAWETFIKRDFSMEEITKRITLYLVSNLQSLPVEVLKYAHPKHHNQLKQHVERHASDCALSQFGIGISLVEIHRKRTYLEERDADVKIEKGDLQLKLEESKIKELEEDIRRTEERTKAFHDFDKEQMDAELERLRQLDEQITEYTIQNLDENEIERMKKERDKIRENVDRMKNDKKQQILEGGKALLTTNTSMEGIQGLDLIDTSNSEAQIEHKEK